MRNIDFHRLCWYNGMWHSNHEENFAYQVQNVWITHGSPSRDQTYYLQEPINRQCHPIESLISNHAEWLRDTSVNALSHPQLRGQKALIHPPLPLFAAEHLRTSQVLSLVPPQRTGVTTVTQTFAVAGTVTYWEGNSSILIGKCLQQSIYFQERQPN